MRKRGTLLTLFLLLCMLLTACAEPTPPVNDLPPAAENNTQTADPAPPLQPEEDLEEPISISHLTVELVVEWGEAERFLSQLGNLSGLLQQGLAQQNCQVDDVTITISTAGGVTGDALASGGVDLAFLPAEDYVARESGARAVLTTDEEICSTVVAVSAAREELNNAFCRALEKALLETEDGAGFLNTYQPGITCVPATEDAIQAVRDWLAEQETDEHGGS